MLNCRNKKTDIPQIKRTLNFQRPGFLLILSLAEGQVAEGLINITSSL